MFRKLAVAGVACSGVMASVPVIAYADDSKFKPVYDDEVARVSSPLPGTSEPSQPKQTILTEAEESLHKELGISSKEKNGYIYRVSSGLEKYIETGREAINSLLVHSEKASADISTKYIDSERKVVETLTSLRGEHEDMLPGSVYVLIAGMTGSIVARRRSFPLRLVSPLLFGTAGLAYFLPKTWDNTRNLVWQYELEHAPGFAEQHAAAGKKAGELRDQSAELYTEGVKQIDSGLKTARETIRSWTGY